MGRLLRQAKRFGLRVAKGEVRSVARSGGGLVLRLQHRTLRCRAAILACGARFRPLGLAGEKKFIGRGLHHAAFEKAARLKGKTVGVVGGGETAAHQALWLARHARRVYIFCRGRALKGIKPLKSGVRAHSRIEFMPNTTVLKLLGNGKLKGVELETAAGSLSARGCLKLDALFVLIGKAPQSPKLQGRTGKRVFVAGDAREGTRRQVVIAAADGMAQAMECERVLSELR